MVLTQKYEAMKRERETEGGREGGGRGRANNRPDRNGGESQRRIGET